MPYYVSYLDILSVNVVACFTRNYQIHDKMPHVSLRDNKHTELQNTCAQGKKWLSHNKLAAKVPTT